MDTAGIAFLVGLGGLAVVALIVVLVVVSARRERARQARIRQWAANRGWTVTTRPGAFEWTSRLPGGNRRSVSLILSGTAYGRPVGVAEYTYTTESMTDSSGNRSTTTHHLIVTLVRLPVSYAPVAVQPRGALSRLGRAIFGDRAASTGHEDFDRQFRVQTKDPATSRALVGPALIAEHLAGRAPPWSIGGAWRVPAVCRQRHRPR